MNRDWLTSSKSSNGLAIRTKQQHVFEALEQIVIFDRT